MAGAFLVLGGGEGGDGAGCRAQSAATEWRWRGWLGPAQSA